MSFLGSWPLTPRVESPQSMDDHMKSASDQVREIRKLVADAQEKLDQVVLALRTLEFRLEDEEQSELHP